MRISDWSSDVCSSDLDRRELRAETTTKMRQRVVIRVQVAGNEAKRQRVVGGTLDLAARMGAGGIAIDQQRQQQRRVIRLAAAPGIDALQFRQIQRSEERRVGKECVRTCRSRR